MLSVPSIRLYHRDGRMDRYRGERKAASYELTTLGLKCK